MTTDETLLMNNGDQITTNNYIDIQNFNKIEENLSVNPDAFNLKQQQLLFYVGGKSYSSFLDCDIEIFKKIIHEFHDSPIYYLALLLKDSD
jgi:hypothetical protein